MISALQLDDEEEVLQVYQPPFLTFAQQLRALAPAGYPSFQTQTEQHGGDLLEQKSQFHVPVPLSQVQSSAWISDQKLYTKNITKTTAHWSAQETIQRLPVKKAQQPLRLTFVQQLKALAPAEDSSVHTNTQPLTVDLVELKSQFHLQAPIPHVQASAHRSDQNLYAKIIDEEVSEVEETKQKRLSCKQVQQPQLGMFAQQLQPCMPSQQSSGNQPNVQLSIQQPAQPQVQSQVHGLHVTTTVKASAKEIQVHRGYLTFAQQLKLLASAQPDQLSQIQASNQEPKPVNHSQMSTKHSSVKPLAQLLPVQEPVISQTLAPAPLSSVETTVLASATAQRLLKEASVKQVETQKQDQQSDSKALKQQPHLKTLAQLSEDHESVKKLPVQLFQKASVKRTEVQTPAVAPAPAPCPPDDISQQLLKNQVDDVHTSPKNLQFTIPLAQWFQEESPIIQWTELQEPPVQIPCRSSPSPVGTQFGNFHQQHQVQMPAMAPEPISCSPDDISHQQLKNQAGVHSSPISLQFDVPPAQWFQEENSIVPWTEFHMHKHFPPVQVPYQSSPFPVGAEFGNFHQQHQAFTQIQLPFSPVPTYNFYPSYPQFLYLPAKFSGDQLFQLYMNAIYYTVSKRQQGKVEWKAVNVFCRAEPDKYYAMIENSEAKTEFPYIKNNNGHLMSHINGNIVGLYLGAGSIFRSPFGNVCYEYPICELLNTNYRLYFADFFCTQNSPSCHKITLVVCRIGQYADMFCRSRNLIELPWYENEFFKVGNDNNFYVTKGSNSLIVDFYYTEAIDLRKGVRKNIQFCGTGDMYKKHLSRLCAGGVKSNIHCSICNV